MAQAVILMTPSRGVLNLRIGDSVYPDVAFSVPAKCAHDCFLQMPAPTGETTKCSTAERCKNCYLFLWSHRVQPKVDLPAERSTQLLPDN
jgi:hypothetical protein